MAEPEIELELPSITKDDIKGEIKTETIIKLKVKIIFFIGYVLII